MPRVIMNNLKLLAGCCIGPALLGCEPKAETQHGAAEAVFSAHCVVNGDAPVKYAASMWRRKTMLCLDGQ
ncbi:hypothetical protein [Pseudomonas sp. PSE14]|uniref:hypothetical protein n=1 Tax=Pseudomonas sp. PSE14 TaxID=3016341 RepID=UPI0023D80FCC|nr:hypothetical protein [Pseudomonas sp. PSE14]WEJ73074.1 hypothetical protein O6P39_04060 [Pseudomonas sp. PSE14]